MQTPNTSPTALLPLSTGIRLSVMMFFQYAIWGAWLPILYPFLTGHRDFNLDQVGAILAAGAVGAIFGPFVAGQIADRCFSTEKFLGLSHLAGAVLVWALADTTEFTPFLIISLIYGFVYAPTIALTNSLAFHHLTDRDRQFGPIRLWGTIGWIVAGIAVGHWLAMYHSPGDLIGAELEAAQDAGRADSFRLSAILGVIMGVYCFTLPHTPPSRAPRRANATLEALLECRRQPLVTLFLLAVPISVIHQFYLVHTSQFLTELQNNSAAAGRVAASINEVFGVGGGGLMTIGQMAEILVLALIPLLAKRLSRKHLLAVGILAYAGRMAIFAYLGDIYPAVLFGVALHGLCFGCFIFVAFMIVDEETTGDVRASAQNLFNLVIVGIGIIVGSWFATSIVGDWAQVAVLTDAGVPLVNESGAPVTETDFSRLFAVPMWMALACFALLVLFYPKERAVKTLPRVA